MDDPASVCVVPGGGRSCTECETKSLAARHAREAYRCRMLAHARASGALARRPTKSSLDFVKPRVKVAFVSLPRPTYYTAHNAASRLQSRLQLCCRDATSFHGAAGVSPRSTSSVPHKQLLYSMEEALSPPKGGGSMCRAARRGMHARAAPLRFSCGKTGVACRPGHGASHRELLCLDVLAAGQDLAGLLLWWPVQIDVSQPFGCPASSDFLRALGGPIANELRAEQALHRQVVS